MEIDIKLNSGKTIKSLFKSPSNTVNMFEDIVAPSLKDNLLVESWGRPYAPSDCSNAYSVKNVKTVEPADENEEWNDTKDHSKWAITESDIGYVCIGGMNHMTSQ